MNCEGCEEQSAIVYVSVTTLDGVVLSRDALCKECALDAGAGLGDVNTALDMKEQVDVR